MGIEEKNGQTEANTNCVKRKIRNQEEEWHFSGKQERKTLTRRKEAKLLVPLSSNTFWYTFLSGITYITQFMTMCNLK